LYALGLVTAVNVNRYVTAAALALAVTLKVVVVLLWPVMAAAVASTGGIAVVTAVTVEEFDTVSPDGSEPVKSTVIGTISVVYFDFSKIILHLYLLWALNTWDRLE
jgi:hypothetical protein